jgi:hypothetical protein
MLEPDEKEEIKRRMDELAREYQRIPRGDPRREEIVNETSAPCWRLDQLLNRTIPAGMDKILKWVQLLTLILVSLVCLAYIFAGDECASGGLAYLAIASRHVPYPKPRFAGVSDLAKSSGSIIWPVAMVGRILVLV